MSVAASISRALANFGRTMTLSRPSFNVDTGARTDASVVVNGYSKGYAAQELTGDILQGDVQVTISNAEIAAAAWPGPPRNGDRLLMDGREYAVQSVEPKYLGATVLVYVLQARG